MPEQGKPEQGRPAPVGPEKGRLDPAWPDPARPEPTRVEPGGSETAGAGQEEVPDGPGLGEIRLRVNGKDRTVSEGLSVLELLESLELNPALVVVELNRTILDRNQYGQVHLNDEDSLELVHFVGGG